MTDSDRVEHEPDVPSPPDSINEFAAVGEWGFKRHPGPFSVSKSGTIWDITIPEDDDQSLAMLKGENAVLVADGEVVGGGVVDDVIDPQNEHERHVLVDQYAPGGANV